MSTCPSCGARSDGNFCPKCGAPLARRSCPSCGSDAPPGARFCTGCGAGLGNGGGGSGDGVPWAKVGWGVAGALLVVVILLLVFPVLNPGGAGSSGPDGGAGNVPAAATGGGTGAVDLSSMTPREAADRLFNRVMSASEAGDQAQVVQFLPMALASYDRVDPLDADARFHVSLLHRAGGQYEEAVAAARTALEASPDHLLNLAAAAEAAALLGDSAEAREHWQRFIDIYDDEVDRDRPGYELHAALLPQLREDARLFLSAGAGG